MQATELRKQIMLVEYAVERQESTEINVSLINKQKLSTTLMGRNTIWVMIFIPDAIGGYIKTIFSNN